ncbi:molybdopterin molybdenumtransferase MoeA [Azospirillum brasilense]|uniref:Molybdopterin molybdenumtransferase n=1 Tax=Azospirillum brasilense TaxID=192 RepID=A0A0P0EF58_AZOBR|nr:MULTISPECIES: gephyrin-like molybdotransferase Glp [Azospirillum]ALJ36512.1 molybdenum cofactor biosynthesis protein MoaA [Azospirillum brasilense]MDW7553572.1 molybdopterin molybdotransferase MoeA [Azospirillum brasilense]MDW7594222.1 molybdopterin molybdotransferase MoeA [Azospirillum brasilense]MDW7629094.1 molybdopterin molybdotransferase MoeA [Azospirillum brasilense]MDX5953763.1 molybdopterin molybdotransferase MoeA [Azospirillum brasilense]
MLQVGEARARILAAFTALPAETVPLPDALGRVLAEPAVARLTQPPFAAAAMDGWAVRATDIVPASGDAPVTLRRIGESAAGHAFAGSVGAGEAVRIFTGAPLPTGADAVVMQEDCEDAGDRVRVGRAVPAGRFIRPAGLDFAAGEELLPKGRLLTARDVALAAAANLPWLRVHRRPRVAVLATGDEIALPGDPLGPSQIVSSNALGLCALVASQGGLAHNLGVAKDDPEHLAAMAAGAAGCDLLVTTGGASQGEHDHVRDVLGGLSLDFYRVAMKPGKPLIFGTANGVPLLGLPGNPVSTGVAALLFLVPVLRRLQGLPAESATLTARLGAPLKANDDRTDFLRATLSTGADGEPVATPFPRQDSAMMSRLARADALIVREPQATAAAVGDRVTVIPLSGGVLSL